MDHDSKITLKDIAERTGVSIGTVHRAIYGKEGVGEATRKRILEEVEKSSYQIDEVASILKRGEIKIAVVLPKAEGDNRFYFRGIWKGIRTAAEPLGKYKVSFRYIESEYALGELDKELMKLYDESVDDIQGLITYCDNEESKEWVNRFQKRGVITALISGGTSSEGICNVKVNHKKGAELAGEFMKYALHEETGKILVLAGESGSRSNRQHTDYFAQYVRRELPGYEMIFMEGLGNSDSKELCLKILEQETVKGAFSCNARNTYGLCEVLAKCNLRKNFITVGTDVFCELEPFFENGLLNASVYQSNREHGSRLVDLLYRYLSGGESSETTEVLPVGLILKSNYEFYMS